MKEHSQIYHFVNDLPIACSYQKLIFDSDHNPNAQITYVNPAFELMFNITSSHVINKSLRNIDFWNTDILSDWMKKFVEVVKNKSSYDKAIYGMLPNQWLLLKILAYEDDYFLIMYTNIEDNEINRFQVDGFFTASLDLMSISTIDGVFLKVNSEFNHLLGYTPEELEGKSFLNFVHHDDVTASKKAMDDVSNGNTDFKFINRLRAKDGSYKYIEWKSHPLGEFVYSSGRDVTIDFLTKEELKAKNQELANLTSQLLEANSNLEALVGIDRLTGLYNRYFFDQRVIHEMESSDRYKQPLSMLIYDIDKFKNVNDTYGHPVGDDVLKRFATIFKDNIRNSDMAFRIGGEEFTLLMPHTTIEQAKIVAEKIRLAFENDTHPVAGKITASFGVAERFKAESIKSWYKRADEALYKAKHSGRNQVVCDRRQDIPMVSVNIEWDAKWDSGNAKIDDQHKLLLELGLEIFNDSYSKVDEAIILEKIDNLINHIHSHFVDEIVILKAKKYPDIEHHAKLHHYLENKALKLKTDFLSGSVKASIFFSFLLDEVIMEHLDLEDVKFFPYL